MTLLGETGLRRLALLNHQKARRLKDALLAVPGVTSPTTRFFNEFALRLPVPAAPVVDALAARGVLAGAPYSRLDPHAGLDDLLLVAATETVTDADIDAYAKALREVVA
jgi:glycine dehydrogenase subunit 1